jgi:hypothetical protein
VNVCETTVELAYVGDEFQSRSLTVSSFHREKLLLHCFSYFLLWAHFSYFFPPNKLESRYKTTTQVGKERTREEGKTAPTFRSQIRRKECLMGLGKLVFFFIFFCSLSSYHIVRGFFLHNEKDVPEKRICTK